MIIIFTGVFLSCPYLEHSSNLADNIRYYSMFKFSLSEKLQCSWLLVQCWYVVSMYLQRTSFADKFQKFFFFFWTSITYLEDRYNLTLYLKLEWPCMPLSGRLWVSISIPPNQNTPESLVGGNVSETVRLSACNQLIYPKSASIDYIVGFGAFVGPVAGLTYFFEAQHPETPKYYVRMCGKVFCPKSRRKCLFH